MRLYSRYIGCFFIPSSLNKKTTMTEQEMTRVAEAAEAVGYKGTGASALISLAEYGFLAREGTPYVERIEDSETGRWDVLIAVPEGYPGGPGFKFAGLDRDEYPTRHDVADRVHELRHPQNYADEPDSADRTIELLRAFHDPNAEATAPEARAILAAKAKTIRKHISGHRPVMPHMTDVLHVAEYASEHQDPVVLLNREQGKGSERRTKTANELLSLIAENWRKMAAGHSGYAVPDEPKTEWEYRF